MNNFDVPTSFFSSFQQDTSRKQELPSYMNIDEFFHQCNTNDSSDTVDVTSITKLSSSDNQLNTLQSHNKHKHLHNKMIQQNYRAASYNEDRFPHPSTALTEKEKLQILSALSWRQHRSNGDDVTNLNSEEPSSSVICSKAKRRKAAPNHQETSLVNTNATDITNSGQQNMQQSSSVLSSHTSRRTSVITVGAASPNKQTVATTDSPGGTTYYQPIDGRKELLSRHAAGESERQVAGRHKVRTIVQETDERVSIITSPERNDYTIVSVNDNEQIKINSRISEKLKRKFPDKPTKSSTKDEIYALDNVKKRQLKKESVVNGNNTQDKYDLLTSNKSSISELERESGDSSPSYDSGSVYGEEIGYGSETSEVYLYKSLGGEDAGGFDNSLAAKSLITITNTVTESTDVLAAGTSRVGEKGRDSQIQGNQVPNKKRGGGKPGRRRKRGYIYDPKPLVPKSKTSTLPEELKDEDYWTRRQRNNEAAKRSRENRRVKELEMMSLVKNLTATNEGLCDRIKELEVRNKMLEQILGRGQLDNSGGCHASSDNI